jgi:hypothetical protein
VELPRCAHGADEVARGQGVAERTAPRVVRGIGRALTVGRVPGRLWLVNSGRVGLRRRRQTRDRPNPCRRGPAGAARRTDRSLRVHEPPLPLDVFRHTELWFGGLLSCSPSMEWSHSTTVRIDGCTYDRTRVPRPTAPHGEITSATEAEPPRARRATQRHRFGRRRMGKRPEHPGPQDPQKSRAHTRRRRRPTAGHRGMPGVRREIAGVHRPVGACRVQGRHFAVVRASNRPRPPADRGVRAGDPPRRRASRRENGGACVEVAVIERDDRESR